MLSEKAVAHLIGDQSPSHPSASQAANAPFLSWSDDDKPVPVARGPPSSGLVSRDVVVTSAAPAAVPFEAKSGSGTRSTLLTNQPSTEIASTRMVESTSPPKSSTAVPAASSVPTRARSFV